VDYASLASPFVVLTESIAKKAQIPTLSEIIYQDESGDRITAKNDDDLKWAFDQCTPGTKITYPKLNVFLTKQKNELKKAKLPKTTRQYKKRKEVKNEKNVKNSEQSEEQKDYDSDSPNDDDYSPKYKKPLKARRKSTTKSISSTSVFRESAITVLRQTAKPMTAREIAILAIDQGLLVTAGKTPFATMSAMLYHRIKG
jgi:hypothetical protein